MLIDLHRSPVKDRAEIEFSRKSKLRIVEKLWILGFGSLHGCNTCRPEEGARGATAFEIVLSVGMSLNGSALGNA